MLEQTKDTIQALKNVGYKRSEFKVQTERIYQGKHSETHKAMYAYGNAKVYIRADKERQLELAQAVAGEGISVTIPVIDGNKSYPIYDTSYNQNPEVSYWNIS